MSSHVGRTYLHSCLKVPIDPCNNCPAPLFSRPKMHLGRLSTTPNTPHTDVVLPKRCSTAETEHKFCCSAIRSLSNLYNSIPDYRDLNHLSGEEFHTTLDTLRTTCRQLEVKTSVFTSEDPCSTATTSSSLPSCTNQKAESRNKKSRKSKQKKKVSAESKNTKNNHDFETDFQKFANQKNLNETTENEICKNSFSKSYKQNLEQEVENLKKSLQEFEAEFKCPSATLNRAKSRSLTHNSSKELVNKNQNEKRKLNAKIPVRTNFTTILRDRLCKSWSFDDIHSLAEPPELLEQRKNNKTFEVLTFKGQSNYLNDPTKLSNYFHEASKPETTEIPKINVDSATIAEQAARDRLPGKPKTQHKHFKNEEYKVPFKLFELDACKKGNSIKHSTPSPIHPVARPNLAATLRAESSKRKVQELKHNCTFRDTTTQFDWEVRKTPAWKTFSLNETHKQILQLRLATRKAEQDLQQREYELNMELMRQRVKSAPLLLEGSTHWAPSVGKLTHACQQEGWRHMCQSNQERTRRRKKSSRSHSCRRKMFLSTPSVLEENNFDNSSNTFRVPTGSNRLNATCKIYGRSSSGTKTQSRNSNHCTTTQKSVKCQNELNSNCLQSSHKKSCKNETNCETVEIDSADELSSLDRAFL